MKWFTSLKKVLRGFVVPPTSQAVNIISEIIDRVLISFLNSVLESKSSFIIWRNSAHFSGCILQKKNIWDYHHVFCVAFACPGFKSIWVFGPVSFSGTLILLFLCFVSFSFTSLALYLIKGGQRVFQSSLILPVKGFSRDQVRSETVFTETSLDLLTW